VRVGAHPPRSGGGERGQVGQQPAVGVEQLLGFVAAHPAVQLLDMPGVLAVDQQRDLVGVEGALDRQPVDHFRAGPAFRGAQHDHRPPRPGAVPARAGVGLEGADGLDRLVEGAGHEFVHRLGLVAFDEVRVPAAAAQERVELVVFDAGQHGRVADLVLAALIAAVAGSGARRLGPCGI